MSKRYDSIRPSTGYVASLLRQLADMVAEDQAEDRRLPPAVSQARTVAARLTEGRRPVPRMHQIGALSVAVVMAFTPSLAEARKPHQPFADKTCAALREKHPTKAPIKVACHAPVAQDGGWADRTIWFQCTAMPGGEQMTLIEDDVFSTRCGGNVYR
jgi:hypothetical protein